MAAPVVDRIEKDLKHNATIVRLDTQNPIGSKLADSYNVRQVPSLLVFNGTGKVVYQGVGIPDPDHVGQLPFFGSSKLAPCIH